MSVPLEFIINDQVVSTPALIDSGAAGNFMSRYYAMHHKIARLKDAFEECRHWLEGASHPFIVLTDHKNLEY